MNEVVRVNQTAISTPFMAPPTALDTLLSYVDGIRAESMDLNVAARDLHFAKLFEFPNLKVCPL